MTVSGLYHIKPNMSMSSFPVECDFSRNEGISKVYPLHWPEKGFVFPPDENARCKDPKCFNKTVTYEPNKLQLQVNSLITLRQ